MELLKHKAVVLDVDEAGTATVEVARGSACAACGEKSSCTLTDDTNIKLKFKNSANLKTGDVVEIGIEKNSFYKSLFAVYIVPLILMLVTAVISDSMTENQLLTAGATISVIIIYFLYLRLKYNGQDKQSYRIL
ncbi:SoxR reducing system RseC family protein [Deferribacteres bacterium DY0037]